MKKRKSYGTLMIDLTDGRVVDLIESREKKDVVIWLSLFPNIKFVSRDGSPTYAAAIQEDHPEARHISDRFHLVKNLTDSITLYLYSVLSGRIIIPLTKKQYALNPLLTTKPSQRKSCGSKLWRPKDAPYKKFVLKRDAAFKRFENT